MRDKRVKTKGGTDVDLKFEVIPGTRTVKFEAPDPTNPGKVLRKRVTLGAANEPALHMSTLAEVQAKVDAAAEKFAETVESQAVVAALLEQVQ